MLEFVVVGAVVATLTYFLLVAVVQVQASAEKTIVELTIRNLRLALKLEVADRLIQGRGGELAGLLDQDPMARAYPASQVRAVDVSVPGAAGLAAGQWGYDSVRRELLYRPKILDGLEIEGGNDVLRWKLVARQSVLPGGKASIHEGFDLIPVANYRWQP